MKTRTRIALILALDQDFTRRMTQGVLQFAGTKEWVLQHVVEDDQLAGNLSQWKPEGMIGSVYRAEGLAACRANGAPYVDVSGETGTGPLPRVICDETAMGILAATHLLERGIKYFAYAGSARRSGPDLREAGFRKQLAASDIAEIPVYRDGGEPSSERMRFEPSRALTSWIAALPKPVGILAWSDALGRQVIDACGAVEARVPDEIAVVGCGNDEITCRMSFPALSSISLPAERVGFEAAALLEKIMGGGSAPKNPLVLPVSSVVTRQSTDVISLPDPDTAAAVRFIRAHSGEWIGVREVLLAVGINRRSLERKFRQYMGRSPLEEIRRMRLEIAKDLLSRTDLPMPIVARRAGFSEGKQLSLMFHNELKITPTAYRRKFRIAAEPQSGETGEEPQK